MFVNKYEDRLAKDISTLQAELDMLGEGHRTYDNEEADFEMNKRMERILDLLSNPTPELEAAIEKANRKTPDYDVVCERVLKSLTSWEGL